MSLDKESEELYKKYVKGEELSLKDKVKAKLIATRFMARNHRLIYQGNSIRKDIKKHLDKCKSCEAKFNELCKDKYSDKKAYDLICNGYFCERCSPVIKKGYEFILLAQKQGLKL